MDVYLMRNYEKQATQPDKEQNNYPFWDYRFRRSTQVQSPSSPLQEGNDTSMNSQGEMHGHSNGSDTGALTFGHDPSRVTLHIIADPHEICPLLDLYQPIVNWVDPNLKLFRVTERADAVSNNIVPGQNNYGNQCSEVPSLAVMVFLKGNEPDGDPATDGQDRIQEALSLFKRPPWRFHHSEKPNQGKINALPNNSQEFFYTSNDLPLWAIRHVHYGNEHLRYVLYVLDSSWPDQVHFYRLILGIEPDLLRDDFCLFTVYKHDNYDVQFSLKKLDQNARVLTLDSVHIQVKVKDVGQLVPLFPNVCRPISDVKWQTTDHDGNIVVLDVVNPMNASSDTRNTQTPTYYSRSDTIVNTNRYITLNQRKERLNSGTTDLSCQTSFSLQMSELNVNTRANCKLSYIQHFDNSALSDSDDLDLDLPSPPIRVTSIQEEDEESLTLTNTSEESGIQMQHGSDDLSFCEEEPLRPCLNKNPSSKFRTIKLKVRFKEEVEAFEDDSYSRMSSGIDSEDQSDSEMETRFPYVPPGVTSNKTFNPPGANHVNMGNLTVSSSQYATSESKEIPNQSSFEHRSTFVHLSTDSQQSHLQANTANVQINANVTINHAGVPSAGVPSSSTVFPARDQYQNVNSSLYTRDAIDNSALPGVVPGKMPVGSHPQRPSSLGDTGPRQNRPPLPPYPEHLTRNPPSYHSVCSKSSAPNTMQKTISLQNLTTSHPTSNTNEHRACTPPSRRSASQSNISQHDIQHKNNSNPHQIISPRRDNLPPPPPVRDSRTKLRSSETNDIPQNNKLPVRSAKTDSTLQTAQTQNGHRRLYFADANANLSTNGSKSRGVEEEDTTLKFTLKFDTCPTSGLACRQEQIGFYV